MINRCSHFGRSICQVGITVWPQYVGINFAVLLHWKRCTVYLFGEDQLLMYLRGPANHSVTSQVNFLTPSLAPFGLPFQQKSCNRSKGTRGLPGIYWIHCMCWADSVYLSFDFHVSFNPLGVILLLRTTFIRVYMLFLCSWLEFVQ